MIVLKWSLLVLLWASGKPALAQLACRSSHGRNVTVVSYRRFCRGYYWSELFLSPWSRGRDRLAWQLEHLLGVSTGERSAGPVPGAANTLHSTRRGLLGRFIQAKGLC